MKTVAESEGSTSALDMDVEIFDSGTLKANSVSPNDSNHQLGLVQLQFGCFCNH